MRPPVYSIIFPVVLVGAVVVGVVSLVGGCTDNATAMRVVAGHGFTDIEITGFRWFGCGEEDTYHTGFQAKNVRGETVTGVVCSGWFKNGTMRLD